MTHHLDNARLELRRALEQLKGSNELDPATRLVFEAFSDRRGLAKEVA